MSQTCHPLGQVLARKTLVSVALPQTRLVPDDPVHKVSLCAPRKEFEQVFAVNYLNYWAVDVVVPMSGSLLKGAAAATLQFQIMAMDGDLFLKVAVASGQGQDHIDVRLMFVQMGALEELQIFLPDHHVFQGIVRLKGDPGFIFPDVGLDGVGSGLPGDRDPVVPIQHKVDHAHFVHLDGWDAVGQADLAHSLPAASDVLRAREKGACEIPTPADAAGDLRHWNGLDAEICLLPQAQTLADKLKGEQLRWIEAQKGQGFLDKCLPPGAVKATFCGRPDEDGATSAGHCQSTRRAGFGFALFLTGCLVHTGIVAFAGQLSITHDGHDRVVGGHDSGGVGPR